MTEHRSTSHRLTNLTNGRDDASVVGMVLSDRILNLYEAKTQLSSLVEQAAAGAEIIIAKAGRPRAKLVAIKESVRRQPGKGKGRVWIARNFDAPLPKNVLKTFAGG